MLESQASPAKAGDALAASAPCNFVESGGRLLAVALGDVAARTGSEQLRCASWDAAPVDSDGVPC